MSTTTRNGPETQNPEATGAGPTTNPGKTDGPDPAGNPRTAVQEALARLALGDGIVHGHLAMYPLLDKRGIGPARDYLTLPEAMERGTAKVGEVSEGGEVPNLAFENSGDRPVLLVEGETLQGAKQNRTLNVSIYVLAGVRLTIPVSCVEAGRWGYQARRYRRHRRHDREHRVYGFGSGRRRRDDDRFRFRETLDAHFAEGRRSKVQALNERMRHSRGSRQSDQGMVWSQIEEKMRSLSVASGTSAMSDIYEQRSAGFERYSKAFRQQPGQVGAVFLVGDDFAGLDLFEHESTFAVLFPKLIRSYALGALERDLKAESPVKTGFEPSADTARTFLGEVAKAESLEYPAVGAGHDVRIDSAGVAGAALAVDERVLHLAAFSKEALVH